jgi:hypothetical protein
VVIHLGFIQFRLAMTMTRLDVNILSKKGFGELANGIE